MFDLFRSRDKAVRILLGALLLLVALSMLTYLVPNYNTGSSGSDPVVAEVGKETITVREVQQSLQGAIRRQGIQSEMIPLYLPQIVEQMVTERAIAYEAKRLGFSVSDEDTAGAIKSLVPSLYQDGKFVGKDVYASMLSQQNLTIDEFETDIARQVLITRLRNIILEGVVISPPEIEQEFRLRNEKVKIQYVKLAPDKFRAEVKITPEEMQGYFNTNRAQFSVPEKRNLTMLLLDQAKVESSVASSDADLRRLYEQNKEQFRTPERVKVKHILLTTTGKSAEEEKAIKAKAEGLLKQVKGGADFADLAKKNSQDPGSAAKGGELDWVVHGQTVPEFEKSAFSLQPKEISDLVKTQYGYHIIQGIEKQQAHLRSFEEAKNDLSATYKKQQASQKMQDLADKAQAALKKNPLHPEQVATDLGLQLVRVDKAGAGDPIPEVGVNKDFEASVMSLRKGEVAQPVLLPTNKMVIVQVSDILPAHPATFEEAAPQIRTRFEQDKLDKLTEQKGKELVEKTKSMGGDLEKAAKSMGLEVTTPDEFTRNGAITGLGSAGYALEAFTKPVGAIIGPLSLPDVKVVAKVAGKTDANLGELASQRGSLREELKAKKARERNSLFEDGLRQQLIKEGKVKIHQDVVDRLRNSYRG